MTSNNEAFIQALNHNLSLLTLVGLTLLIIWVIAIIIMKKLNKRCPSLEFVIKHSLPIGFFVSLIGSILTLYYSDYLGILPCGLCWFQRVALYSQVFLFGLAWYKKDFEIFSYTLLLSIFGEIIALYHHYLQMGYSEFIPCPVVASTIDCAKPTFVEYGFVTFPFMAVVLFIGLILLSILVKFYNKR